MPPVIRGRGGRIASYNSMSGRKCLVSGCRDMRLNRGYCSKHETELENTSTAINITPDSLLFPTLMSLNLLLDKTPLLKHSPYIQTLLGSVRHLIMDVSPERDEAVMFQSMAKETLPSINSKKTKKDKDSNVPFVLPHFLYKDIFHLNESIATLVNSDYAPNGIACLTYGTLVTNKKKISPEQLNTLSNVYDKPPIVDIQVAFSRKEQMPPSYTILSKTITGKTADLNSGAGGKDVYLSYQRRYTSGPCVYTSVDSTPLSISVNDPEIEISSSDSPRNSSTRTHYSDQPSSPSPKNSLLTKSSFSSDSQLQPLTSLKILFPDIGEEPPLGYELVTCNFNNNAANLNSGVNTNRNVYVSVHRSGPSPDYELYAREMYHKHQSSATNTNTDLTWEAVENFTHMLKNVSSVSPNINTNYVGFTGDNTDESRNSHLLHYPLNTLSESDRAKGADNPIVGTRGCGAPIVDIGVVFTAKESVPIDWQEVRWTPSGNKANLASGTDGAESVLIYRVNTQVVLDKVYKPFLKWSEKEKDNTEGVDAKTVSFITRLCSIITACLYITNEDLVVLCLDTVRKLHLNSCPPQLINALIHTVCDAVPNFLSHFNVSSLSSILRWFLYIVQTSYTHISTYTLMRILDVFYLLRNIDKRSDISKIIIDVLITEANKTSALLLAPGNTCPLSAIDPLIITPAFLENVRNTLTNIAPDYLLSNARLMEERRSIINPLLAVPTVGDLADSKPSSRNNSVGKTPIMWSRGTIRSSVSSCSGDVKLDMVTKDVIQKINDNPYDMCANLIRSLVDTIIDAKQTDFESGKLHRRPFGSPTYMEVSCITDRLVTQTGIRQWLLQPPLGYNINPELIPPYVNTNTTSQLPTLSNTPTSSNGIPTLTDISTSGPLPTLTDLARSSSTQPPSLPTLSDLSNSNTPLQVPTLATLQISNSKSTPPPLPTALDIHTSNNSIPPGLPTLTDLQSPPNSEQITSPTSALKNPIRKKRMVTMHAADVKVAAASNMPTSGKYSTYTKLFYSGADLDANGEPYKWRFTKFSRPELQFETEQERRRRRKLEKQHLANKQDELTREKEMEWEKELNYKRYILHNTSHISNVNYKAERNLINIVLYVCKMACVDQDSVMFHPSSMFALQSVNINNPTTTPQYCFAHLLPHYLQNTSVNDSETANRRAHALTMLLRILRRADGFLRSNKACITLLRRYILPTLIHNCATDTPFIFSIVLNAFITIFQNFRKECMIEIGIFIDKVLLEMLESSSCSNEMKKGILDVLEMVIQSPTDLINLYYSQDYVGYRNVYEKFIRILGAMTQNKSKFKQHDDNNSNWFFKDFDQYDNVADMSTDDGKSNSNETDESSKDKAVAVTTQDMLGKVALRMLVKHLHMMAQWCGVPFYKRTKDASDALKYTCMSYLHLLTSDRNPNSESILFLKPTAEYEDGVRLANKNRLDAESRGKMIPIYNQAIGILEYVLKSEGKHVLLSESGLVHSLAKVRRDTLTSKSRKNSNKTLATSVLASYNTLIRGSTGSIGPEATAAAEASTIIANKDIDNSNDKKDTMNKIPFENRAVISAAKDKGLLVETKEEADIRYLLLNNADDDNDDMLFGDNVDISFAKVLGNLPTEDIEMGMDIGMFLHMDKHVVGMIKKLNCPSIVSSESPFLKDRLEYEQVYREVSEACRGKDSLKPMLQILQSKYPRMYTPHHIASLIFRNDAIDPTVLGDFIANCDDKYFNTEQYAYLRHRFVRQIDFAGMPFLNALRYYLTYCGFRLPGEGQKIDRLIEAFVEGYCHDNPDDFASTSAAHVVCFSIVMLNTDLHDSRLKTNKKVKRMTLREFMMNLRDCNDGLPLDPIFLTNIYTNIAINPILWKDANNEISAAPSVTSSQSATNVPPAPPSLDDSQAIICLVRAHHHQKLSDLQALGRRAVGSIRSYSFLKQTTDLTLSTQIVNDMWGKLWSIFLEGLAKRIEISPSFTLSLIPRDPLVPATSQNTHAIFDSNNDNVIDIETLHWCIDGLSYAASISICIQNYVATEVFSRILSKITLIEKQCDVLKSSKATNNDLVTNMLMENKHLEQYWLTEFNRMTCSREFVGACKHLLRTGMKTKHSISFQRRQQILKRLQSDFGNDIVLVSPLRSFVKDGKLIKLSSSGKKVEYIFFLFNDILMYASEDGDKYKLHRVVHLSLLRIVEMSNLATPHAFKIVSPQKTFIVVANSREEKDAWVKLLLDSCNLIQVQRSNWIKENFKVLPPTIASNTTSPIIPTVPSTPVITDEEREQKEQERYFASPQLGRRRSSHSEETRGSVTSEGISLFGVNSVASFTSAASDPDYNNDTSLNSTPPRTRPPATPLTPTSSNQEMLKRYAAFATAGPQPIGTVYTQESCLLCLRIYPAFRRKKVKCPCCNQFVCSECIERKLTYDPKEKPDKICHACEGFVTGIIGDQPTYDYN